MSSRNIVMRFLVKLSAITTSRDNVDTPINNPYERDSIENRLYLKCWIDTVQWHFEDLIRDPHIVPEDGMSLKRRIDRSNQDRTDLVEQIDSYFRPTLFRRENTGRSHYQY